MSKSNFGRCAAVGVAGLTAVSSLVSGAMVASAEAYPTYVYEFVYGGIGTTQVYYKSIVAVSDNQYVKYTNQSDAQAVFDPAKGFVAKNMTAFWGEIDDAYIAYKANNGTTVTQYYCTDRNAGDDWQYAIANSFSSVVTPVYVEESYESRSGNTLARNFAFKSLSERNAALSSIATKNKTNYSTKFNAANQALGKDLSDAINAYRTAQNDTIRKVQDAVNTYFRNNPAATTCTLGTNVTIDVSALDTVNISQTATIGKTAAAGGDATLAEWARIQSNYVNARIKALTNVSTQIKNEFREAYQVTNWAFDYDAAKDGATTAAAAAPFVTADGPVAFSGSIGSYIQYSGAAYETLGGTDLELTEDYYRTVGQYVSPKSYAFSGEIIKKANRTSTSATREQIAALLLDSDRWSQFSVLIDGKPTDNGNTSEPGNSNTTTDDNTDTTSTTWYPDSASYRAASEVSYLGKNGVWYTSSSAASIYGGGYTGTSKNSGFGSVNSSANGKAIYFNSTTGTYSTSSSSYSYVVKEATNTSDNSNDPYYNHVWGNNNTTTTVPAGSPAISGLSKYAGWTNISSYITYRGKSGATYTINMNDESIVPASVLAAAKAKNVTLTFVNDNGSKVTVKPGKVSTTSDLRVSVTYNVKDIKTSLVNKAKKVNPGTVSTAQVRIGTDGSIDGTATVNVKFSTKRSGCTVKAYRLTASGTLVKEATGTVASTGRVNLNLTKGGSYLLVVID